jgi:hypothetical protein
VNNFTIFSDYSAVDRESYDALNTTDMIVVTRNYT